MVLYLSVFNNIRKVHLSKHFTWPPTAAGELFVTLFQSVMFSPDTFTSLRPCRL